MNFKKGSKSPRFRCCFPGFSSYLNVQGHRCSKYKRKRDIHISGWIESEEEKWVNDRYKLKDNLIEFYYWWSGDVVRGMIFLCWWQFSLPAFKRRRRDFGRWIGVRWWFVAVGCCCWLYIDWRKSCVTTIHLVKDVFELGSAIIWTMGCVGVVNGSWGIAKSCSIVEWKSSVSVGIGGTDGTGVSGRSCG